MTALDTFSKAIQSPDPYYLCLGQCYITHIYECQKKLLDKPAHAVNFQGAATRGLYCYSLLRKCKGVLLFTAWANISCVATTKYHHHWRKVLSEVLAIKCPVVMLDATIKFKLHRHKETKQPITREQLDKRRATYKKEVIEEFMTHPQFTYIDLVDIIGHGPHLVDEYPTPAPWHYHSKYIKSVARYFMSVMHNKPNEELLK